MKILDRCQVCHKWIFPWQPHEYEMLQISKTGEYIKHSYRHYYCNSRGLTPHEREILK